MTRTIVILLLQAVTFNNFSSDLIEQYQIIGIASYGVLSFAHLLTLILHNSSVVITFSSDAKAFIIYPSSRSL